MIKNNKLQYKNYLEENKIFRNPKEANSLITKDYNFFLGRIYFTSNDESQNTFAYRPTLDTLELKKDKGTDYVLSRKSNGVYNSNLRLLHTAFLHSINLLYIKWE